MKLRPWRRSTPPECAAPHTSLYLDPSGVVSSCCANSMYVLGRIGPGENDTLRSAWNGERLERQRVALDSGRFDHGCAECGDGVREGARETILAREFDQYWPEADADYPTYIDFALSNTCNLQCAMCNGELSSAIRSQREHRPPLANPYGDRFFAELEEFLPHLSEASFKGGEPFLSREARRVWDMLLEQDLRPRITVTTNGTQWNDRVEHYVRSLGMHVILSVDGTTDETVSSIRVGTSHRELTENIHRFQIAAEASGGSLVLNYCLMPQNWREFVPFLLDADSRGLRVHAIPVVAPAEYSLQALPKDELRAVVEELRSLDHGLALNAGVLSQQLGRLDGWLSEPISEHQVELRPRTPHAARRFERALRRFEAECGGPLVELRLSDGFVTTAASAPWADDLLRPSSLVGLADFQLVDEIAERVGGAPRIRIEQVGDGITRATITMLQGSVRQIDALALMAASGRGVERIVIARPTES